MDRQADAGKKPKSKLKMLKNIILDRHNTDPDDRYWIDDCLERRGLGSGGGTYSPKRSGSSTKNSAKSPDGAFRFSSSLQKEYQRRIDGKRFIGSGIISNKQYARKVAEAVRTRTNRNARVIPNSKGFRIYVGPNRAQSSKPFQSISKPSFPVTYMKKKGRQETDCTSMQGGVSCIRCGRTPPYWTDTRIKTCGRCCREEREAQAVLTAVERWVAKSGLNYDDWTFEDGELKIFSSTEKRKNLGYDAVIETYPVQVVNGEVIIGDPRTYNKMIMEMPVASLPKGQRKNIEAALEGRYRMTPPDELTFTDNGLNYKLDEKDSRPDEGYYSYAISDPNGPTDMDEMRGFADTTIQVNVQDLMERDFVDNYKYYGVENGMDAKVSDLDEIFKGELELQKILDAKSYSEAEKLGEGAFRRLQRENRKYFYREGIPFGATNYLPPVEVGEAGIISGIEPNKFVLGRMMQLAVASDQLYNGTHNQDWNKPNRKNIPYVGYFEEWKLRGPDVIEVNEYLKTLDGYDPTLNFKQNLKNLGNIVNSGNEAVDYIDRLFNIHKEYTGQQDGEYSDDYFQRNTDNKKRERFAMYEGRESPALILQRQRWERSMQRPKKQGQTFGRY